MKEVIPSRALRRGRLCAFASCLGVALLSGMSLPPALAQVDGDGDATITDVAPPNDATTGTMGGTAGTIGGAATYTVPLVLPPGRAGMQPALSLDYNSRGGDGMLGMGWSLAGLSSIHRCPQTPEQDGRTIGVSYSDTDRLCLDGQRLVAVSGGTYGQSGTEYRTEVDSHARITQIGGNLESPSTSFKIEQKSGRIRYYGISANGRVVPNGAETPSGVAVPLSWLVEKIEDRVGNNQTYTYHNYQNGEVLPETIRYTGYTPTGSAGTRTVTFAYESRSTAASGARDLSSSYLAGGLTLQTQALRSITTAANGSVARIYTPS